MSAGWADIYGVGTPCQWIDITDVPAGDYLLQLTVNPTGAVLEVDSANNVVRIPYHVPAEEPCIGTSEICENGQDDDCDGSADYEDSDDCEPPCWNQGAEYCGDREDNDCDGLTDEACEVTEGGESCSEAIALTAEQGEVARGALGRAE